MSGYEVDFLARYPDGAQELIQVCADPADERTRIRELRALEEAAASHPRATPHLLVLDRDGVAGLTPAGALAQAGAQTARRLHGCRAWTAVLFFDPWVTFQRQAGRPPTTT